MFLPILFICLVGFVAWKISLSILLSCLVGFVAICYWFVQHSFQYWKNRGIPHIKPEFPYGNGKGIDKTKHLSELIEDTYKMFKGKGPVYGLYLSVRPIAVATDIELIKNIFTRDSANFLNRGLYYNEKDDPMSAHMLHNEDDEWHQLRSKISPTFSSGKIKMMYSSVFDVTDRLIKKINSVTVQTGSVDVKDIFGRYTTDVIGVCAFGIECNSLEDEVSDFHEMGKSIFKIKGFAKAQFCTLFPNLARRLGFTVYPKFLNDFYSDVVKKTIEYREANPEENRKDFIGSLMALRDPSSPNPLTMNQIIAQSFAFFLAGFETSSTTLTYCTYELSLNKDIQEKVRESVLETMKKHGNQLTYECINDMKYLEQCLNESSRIHPAVFALPRQVKEDYPVPNSSIVLEKGKMVMIPLYGFQRDPDIFPDPMKFDPERFSPNEVGKRSPFTSVPFGAGPRVCIGMRFAMIEMKLALAQLLINFEFSLDHTKTTTPLQVDINSPFIAAPRDGVFIKFEQRKN